MSRENIFPELWNPTCEIKWIMFQKCVLEKKQKLNLASKRDTVSKKYKNNFIRTKILVLVKGLRTSQEQSHACCSAEHKNKVSRQVTSLAVTYMDYFYSQTLTLLSFSMSKSYCKMIHLQICLFTIFRTVKFHFPPVWAFEQTFFLFEFLLYYYSNLWYYRSLLYCEKF